MKGSREASLRISVVVAVLLFAGCGSPDSSATTGPSSTATSAGAGVTTTSGALTSTTGTSTTAVPSTTTAPAPTTTAPATTLPGETFGIAPQPGAVMAVIGVAHDDVLNLRAAPGTDQPVLVGLGPTQADMIATGRSQLLRSVVWFELQASGTVGWASASYLGYLGATDDLTSQIVGSGPIPVAKTMSELGRLVADAVGVDEDGFSSRISMTVAPSVGDLGEVTYDVVGLQDDSLRGIRLHVFGAPTEGGEGFFLKSVEATLLCGRGVTEEGLCI